MTEAQGLTLLFFFFFFSLSLYFSSSSSWPTPRFLPEEHTEYWGTLVTGGWGSNNIQPSARACHDSCVDKADRPSPKDCCNAWVYHPQNKECWLKNQRDPSVPAVRASGPLIAWTSGRRAEKRKRGRGRGRCAWQLSLLDVDLLSYFKPQSQSQSQSQFQSPPLALQA